MTHTNTTTAVAGAAPSPRKRVALGAAALLAAGALAVGGAGTFAAWEASHEIPGGEIQAAAPLAITATPDGDWGLIHSNGKQEIVPSIFGGAVGFFPGDEATRFFDLDVAGLSEGMRVELVITEGAIQPVDAGAAADVALAAAIGERASVKLDVDPANLPDWLLSLGDGVYEFTGTAVQLGQANLAAVVSLGVDPAATTAIAGGRVMLEGSLITVRQVV